MKRPWRLDPIAKHKQQIQALFILCDTPTPQSAQAVESVTDVLDQVLKIRSKLENQIGKLEVLKDAESQKNLMLAVSAPCAI